ncbi:MAG TPA: helix-turn-helix domain-containing protein [Solirubrobacteraceae bacterium]|nr:helix-turn-helix domain-containing protein [Solirubrobacteraceae bacterium]
MFDRFREMGFSSAGGEDAAYIAGVRTAITEVVEYNIMAVEGDERGLDSIPPALAAQAHRAARNGVSLEKVLLRYNAGRALIEDVVVQEADQSELASHRMALRQVLGTLAIMHDHWTSSGVNEYQCELARVAHSPELRRLERVQRLLAGGRVDSSELGYELDAWHLALIAMGSRAGETVRRLASGLGRELLSVPRGEQTVWAWLGGQRRLTAADLERPLSAKQATGVSLAVGEPERGIDGWRLSHRQAQASMLVALHRPQRLTRYADVALLAAVLGDEQLARSLVEIHLSPLEDERDAGAVSRQTLRAYFAAACNAATAAAALGVDRHTVQRRLHAIEKRLGRQLHTCQAELVVALRVQELGELAGLSDAQPPAQSS